MKFLPLAISTLISVFIAVSAFGNDTFTTKEVGFLLAVVSATDTTGTPIASYLHQMAQLGDKWDTITQQIGNINQDGTYEDQYQIVNNGCGINGHPVKCKVATLVIKVKGKLGSIADYETTYSEK